jgi:hypothetical protein
MVRVVVGLIMRDLVYIEDGNPLRNTNGTLNIDTLLLSGSVIHKFLELRTPKFAFDLDPVAACFLEALPGTIDDQDVLYQLSTAVMPLKPQLNLSLDSSMCMDLMSLSCNTLLELHAIALTPTCAAFVVAATQ